ncbi:YqzM family protein [Peribacillus sp. NPDC097264]
MNEFEKNVQSKTDDVADSAIGFIASFVFFAAMFTIAVVVKAVGS